MALTVRMACGCVVDDWVDKAWKDVDGKPKMVDNDPPMCKPHNERRVQQVNSAVPRILAVDCKAEGPYVKRG